MALTQEVQRNERLFIRVSEAEKRKFNRLARARNTDISELARQILHREADSKPLKASA
jgi:hypothetical protein